MKLSGKTAIITGAARGLGLETANLFCREGARVIGVDINEPVAKDISEISTGPGSLIFKKVDITSVDSVRQFCNYVEREIKTLNILVNNAAVHIVGNIEEISVENFKKTLDTNVLGMFLVTKYLIPLIKQNKDGGSIINVASNLGLMGAAGRIAYPTSKGAVINFTRCMALDYAGHNIRVNSVAPGAIDTEMTKNFFKEQGSEEFMRQNRALHPLDRFAEPLEIAKGILFLASDDSSYATGSVLVLDGGYTCGK
jgi:NAD(P)-dependent dehydrogenase (short-subunit alcohol dehydrogenase family)